MPSAVRTLDESRHVSAMFIEELGAYLNHLRERLRGNDVIDMEQTSDDLVARILCFVKQSCDDYEGDLFVPRLGMREVADFQLNVTWEHLRIILIKSCRTWAASCQEDVDLNASGGRTQGDEAF